MNYTEFLNYKEQHCKFRLRSGKEVYGVIWEKCINDRREYYFASSSAHKIYTECEQKTIVSKYKDIVSSVSLEDVVKAEVLSH